MGRRRPSSWTTCWRPGSNPRRERDIDLWRGTPAPAVRRPKRLRLRWYEQLGRDWHQRLATRAKFGFLVYSIGEETFFRIPLYVVFIDVNEDQGWLADLEGQQGRRGRV